jgi:hypothetical protein
MQGKMGASHNISINTTAEQFLTRKNQSKVITTNQKPWKLDETIGNYKDPNPGSMTSNAKAVLYEHSTYTKPQNIYIIKHIIFY